MASRSFVFLILFVLCIGGGRRGLFLSSLVGPINENGIFVAANTISYSGSTYGSLETVTLTAGTDTALTITNCNFNDGLRIVASGGTLSGFSISVTGTTTASYIRLDPDFDASSTISFDGTSVNGYFSIYGSLADASSFEFKNGDTNGFLLSHGSNIFSGGSTFKVTDSQIDHRFRIEAGMTDSFVELVGNTINAPSAPPGWTYYSLDIRTSGNDIINTHFLVSGNTMTAGENGCIYMDPASKFAGTSHLDLRGNTLSAYTRSTQYALCVYLKSGAKITADQNERYKGDVWIQWDESNSASSILDWKGHTELGGVTFRFLSGVTVENVEVTLDSANTNDVVQWHGESNAPFGVWGAGTKITLTGNTHTHFVRFRGEFTGTTTLFDGNTITAPTAPPGYEYHAIDFEAGSTKSGVWTFKDCVLTALENDAFNVRPAFRLADDTILNLEGGSFTEGPGGYHYGIVLRFSGSTSTNSGRLNMVSGDCQGRFWMSCDGPCPGHVIKFLSQTNLKAVTFDLPTTGGGMQSSTIEVNTAVGSGYFYWLGMLENSNIFINDYTLSGRLIWEGDTHGNTITVQNSAFTAPSAPPGYEYHAVDWVTGQHTSNTYTFRDSTFSALENSGIYVRSPARLHSDTVVNMQGNTVTEGPGGYQYGVVLRMSGSSNINSARLNMVSSDIRGRFWMSCDGDCHYNTINFLDQTSLGHIDFRFPTTPGNIGMRNSSINFQRSTITGRTYIEGNMDGVVITHRDSTQTGRVEFNGAATGVVQNGVKLYVERSRIVTPAAPPGYVYHAIQFNGALTWTHGALDIRESHIDAYEHGGIVTCGTCTLSTGTTLYLRNNFIGAYSSSQYSISLNLFGVNSFVVEPNNDIVDKVYIRYHHGAPARGLNFNLVSTSMRSVVISPPAEGLYDSNMYFEHAYQYSGQQHFFGIDTSAGPFVNCQIKYYNVSLKHGIEIFSNLEGNSLFEVNNSKIVTPGIIGPANPTVYFNGNSRILSNSRARLVDSHLQTASSDETIIFALGAAVDLHGWFEISNCLVYCSGGGYNALSLRLNQPSGVFLLNNTFLDGIWVGGSTSYSTFQFCGNTVGSSSVRAITTFRFDKYSNTSVTVCSNTLWNYIRLDAAHHSSNVDIVGNWIKASAAPAGQSYHAIDFDMSTTPDLILNSRVRILNNTLEAQEDGAIVFRSNTGVGYGSSLFVSGNTVESLTTTSEYCFFAYVDGGKVFYDETNLNKNGYFWLTYRPNSQPHTGQHIHIANSDMYAIYIRGLGPHGIQQSNFTVQNTITSAWTQFVGLYSNDVFIDIRENRDLNRLIWDIDTAEGPDPDNSVVEINVIDNVITTPSAPPGQVYSSVTYENDEMNCLLDGRGVIHRYVRNRFSAGEHDGIHMQSSCRLSLGTEIYLEDNWIRSWPGRYGLIIRADGGKVNIRPGNNIYDRAYFQWYHHHGAHSEIYLQGSTDLGHLDFILQDSPLSWVKLHVSNTTATGYVNIRATGSATQRILSHSEIAFVGNKITHATVLDGITFKNCKLDFIGNRYNVPSAPPGQSYNALRFFGSNMQEQSVLRFNDNWVKTGEHGGVTFCSTCFISNSSVVYMDDNYIEVPSNQYSVILRARDNGQMVVGKNNVFGRRRWFEFNTDHGVPYVGPSQIHLDAITYGQQLTIDCHALGCSNIDIAITNYAMAGWRINFDGPGTYSKSRFIFKDSTWSTYQLFPFSCTECFFLVESCNFGSGDYISLGGGRDWTDSKLLFKDNVLDRLYHDRLYLRNNAEYEVVGNTINSASYGISFYSNGELTGTSSILIHGNTITAAGSQEGVEWSSTFSFQDDATVRIVDNVIDASSNSYPAIYLVSYCTTCHLEISGNNIGVTAGDFRLTIGDQEDVKIINNKLNDIVGNIVLGASAVSGTSQRVSSCNVQNTGSIAYPVALTDFTEVACAGGNTYSRCAAEAAPQDVTVKPTINECKNSALNSLYSAYTTFESSWFSVPSTLSDLTAITAVRPWVQGWGLYTIPRTPDEQNQEDLVFECACDPTTSWWVLFPHFAPLVPPPVIPTGTWSKWGVSMTREATVSLVPPVPTPAPPPVAATPSPPAAASPSTPAGTPAPPTPLALSNPADFNPSPTSPTLNPGSTPPPPPPGSPSSPSGPAPGPGGAPGATPPTGGGGTGATPPPTVPQASSPPSLPEAQPSVPGAIPVIPGEVKKFNLKATVSPKPGTTELVVRCTATNGHNILSDGTGDAPTVSNSQTYVVDLTETNNELDVPVYLTSPGDGVTETVECEVLGDKLPVLVEGTTLTNSASSTTTAAVGLAPTTTTSSTSEAPGATTTPGGGATLPPSFPPSPASLAGKPVLHNAYPPLNKIQEKFNEQQLASPPSTPLSPIPILLEGENLDTLGPRILVGPYVVAITRINSTHATAVVPPPKTCQELQGGGGGSSSTPTSSSDVQVEGITVEDRVFGNSERAKKSTLDADIRSLCNQQQSSSSPKVDDFEWDLTAESNTVVKAAVVTVDVSIDLEEGVDGIYRHRMQEQQRNLHHSSINLEAGMLNTNLTATFAVQDGNTGIIIPEGTVTHVHRATLASRDLSMSSSSLLPVREQSVYKSGLMLDVPNDEVEGALVLHVTRRWGPRSYDFDLSFQVRRPAIDMVVTHHHDTSASATSSNSFEVTLSSLVGRARGIVLEVYIEAPVTIRLIPSAKATTGTSSSSNSASLCTTQFPGAKCRVPLLLPALVVGGGSVSFLFDVSAPDFYKNGAYAFVYSVDGLNLVNQSMTGKYVVGGGAQGGTYNPALYVTNVAGVRATDVNGNALTHPPGATDAAGNLLAGDTSTTTTNAAAVTPLPTEAQDQGATPAAVLKEMGIFSFAGDSVVCTNPLIFSWIAFFFLSLIGFIVKMALRNKSSQITTWGGSVPVWRHLILHNVWIQLFVPCHSGCTGIHVTTAMNHCISLILMISGCSWFLELSAPSTSIFAAVLGVLVAQALRPLLQYYYWIVRFDEEELDEQLSSRQHQQQAFGEEETPGLKGKKHRKMSRVDSNLTEASTAERKEILKGSSFANIGSAKQFGGTLDALGDVQLDEDIEDDVVVTASDEQKAASAAAAGQTLARLDEEVQHVKQLDGIDFEEVSEGGNSANLSDVDATDLRSHHSGDHNNVSTTEDEDKNTTTDLGDDGGSLIAAPTITDRFVIRGHIFSGVFLVIASILCYFFLAQLTTATSCSFFTDALIYGLLIDFGIMQPLSMLLVYVYHWFVDASPSTEEDGDSSGGDATNRLPPVWAQLHPREGEHRPIALM